MYPKTTTNALITDRRTKRAEVSKHQEHNTRHVAVNVQHGEHHDHAGLSLCRPIPVLGREQVVIEKVAVIGEVESVIGGATGRKNRGVAEGTVLRARSGQKLVGDGRVTSRNFEFRMPSGSTSRWREGELLALDDGLAFVHAEHRRDV